MLKSTVTFHFIAGSSKSTFARNFKSETADILTSSSSEKTKLNACFQ